MRRRRLLAAGCAQCAAFGLAALSRPAGAQAVPPPGWVAPMRFTRPDLATDEGGEPKFKAHADDPSVPDAPQTEFHIAEDDETTDYESPAFLRYQAK